MADFISKPVLLLVGLGKMGAALCQGWQHAKPPSAFDVYTIDPQAPITPRHFTSLDALPATVKPAIVFFAVKPQQLEALLPAYAARFGTAPFYITIAAGKEVAFYEKHLGSDAHVVRTMPNTPAIIGQGMTALFATNNVTEAERKIAQALFATVGETLWVEEETLLHAVTALSGSGPAYAFLFMDALTQAGIAAGLEEPVARLLAAVTLRGSAALAEQSNETLEQLRVNVTSPGGTTAAALEVLVQNDRLAGLVLDAVKAAVKRSKELAI